MASDLLWPRARTCCARLYLRFMTLFQISVPKHEYSVLASWPLWPRAGTCTQEREDMHWMVDFKFWYSTSTLVYVIIVSHLAKCIRPFVYEWIFSTKALVYFIAIVVCPPSAGHMICGKTCIRHLTCIFGTNTSVYIIIRAPGRVGTCS